jgi:hypothetical protein
LVGDDYLIDYGGYRAFSHRLTLSVLLVLAGAYGCPYSHLLPLHPPIPTYLALPSPPHPHPRSSFLSFLKAKEISILHDLYFATRSFLFLQLFDLQVAASDSPGISCFIPRIDTAVSPRHNTTSAVIHLDD